MRKPLASPSENNSRHRIAYTCLYTHWKERREEKEGMSSLCTKELPLHADVDSVLSAISISYFFLASSFTSFSCCPSSLFLLSVSLSPSRTFARHTRAFTILSSSRSTRLLPRPKLLSLFIDLLTVRGEAYGFTDTCSHVGALPISFALSLSHTLVRWNRKKQRHRKVHPPLPFEHLDYRSPVSSSTKAGVSLGLLRPSSRVFDGI